MLFRSLATLTLLAVAPLALHAEILGDWQFEDTPGFLADSGPSSRTLTATPSGFTQSAVSGPNLGKSAVLSGGGYASTPDSPVWTDTSTTIEVLFNASNAANANTQVLVGQWNASGNQRSWLLGLNSGKIRLLQSSDGSGSSTNDVLAVLSGKDYYVALRLDGSSGTIYLKNLTDNTAMETASVTGLTSLKNSTAPLAIGSTTQPSSPFSGTIGRVIVHDTPVSDEILLYPPPPPAPNTLANGYNGSWYEITSGKGSYPNKYGGGTATYPQQINPMAIYAPAVNKTFFVFGGSNKGEGDVNTTIYQCISYYDHATRSVANPRIVIDKQTTDAHDNPALCIDPSGYLWVFSNTHGNNRRSYIFKSDQPYDITHFTEVPLDTAIFPSNRYNYGSPWYVPGQGFLLLYTRYTGSVRQLYTTTSADGVTWTTPKPFSDMRDGQYQISWQQGQTVGTALNVHIGSSDNRTNLYYLQTTDSGTTWTKADGTAVATPLTSDVNDALVHDYNAEGKNVYLKDLNFDADGRPVILFLTTTSALPGPATRFINTARWDGSQWIIRPVVATDHNYDHGSLYIEPDGTWRVIGPWIDGPQAYGTGGEVAVWTSTNQGLTWQLVRQVTNGSDLNHSYVRRPLNANDDFYGLWADGNAFEPSDSRMFYTDKHTDALLRLPTTMTGNSALPEVVDVFQPNTDPDGDGQTTGSEFFAGTHPRNPASVFQISETDIVAGELTLTFPSVLGKTYRVMTSGTLQSGSWSPLISGIVGTGESITIKTPFATPPTRLFYRAEVEP